MNRKTMKKLPMMLMCAAALAATNPAMPAYAKKKTQVTRSATSATERMRDAASSVQKAFDKKSLTDLAKLCDYPLDIFFEDDSYKEVKSAAELKNLGEDRVCTGGLIDAVDQADPSNLPTLGENGLKIGGAKGVDMYKIGNSWKIRAIYQ